MIYFIQSGNDGPIKIGYSSNVTRRLNKMQSDTPDELYVLGVLPYGRDEEDRLHSLFGKYRHRAEWYIAAPELLSYVMSYTDSFIADVYKNPSDTLVQVRLAQMKRTGVGAFSVPELAYIYQVTQTCIYNSVHSKDLCAEWNGNRVLIIKGAALAEFKRPKRGRPKKEIDK